MAVVMSIPWWICVPADRGRTTAASRHATGHIAVNEFPRQDAPREAKRAHLVHGVTASALILPTPGTQVLRV